MQPDPQQVQAAMEAMRADAQKLQDGITALRKAIQAAGPAMLEPIMSVEVVVPEAMVDKVVAVICSAAKTGSIGDGKVFVLPMGEAVRIRTGETGEAAI